MTPLRSASHVRHRGFAIIMAMVTVALVATIAAAIVPPQAALARYIELLAKKSQAHSALQAGLDWASAILHDDLRASQADHLRETWAMKLEPIVVEGGTLVGRIEDSQGKFNLNNIVSDGKIVPAQLTRFARLLMLLGFGDDEIAVLVDSLADWLDADDEPRSSGAEDAHYGPRRGGYLTANRPLVDTTELAMVRGFDARVLNRLSPFVSVLPRATTVNANTASAEVLAAVVDGLSLEAARRIVLTRDLSHFRELSDVQRALPKDTIAIAADISCNSEFFEASMTVAIGEVRAQGAALLWRMPRAWPTIVWRRSA